MYPRLKVRTEDQDDDDDFSESDSESRVFLKFIDSLHFEGILKNSKQVGERPKQIARSNSAALRPRAVLSSPENDELIGSINDLVNKESRAHRQRDVRVKVGNHEAKVSSNQGPRIQAKKPNPKGWLSPQYQPSSQEVGTEHDLLQRSRIRGLAGR
ncbi:hypothetical protein AAHE18_12G080100 [Arachis hypogaea]